MSDTFETNQASFARLSTGDLVITTVGGTDPFLSAVEVDDLAAFLKDSAPTKAELKAAQQDAES